MSAFNEWRMSGFFQEIDGETDYQGRPSGSYIVYSDESWIQMLPDGRYWTMADNADYINRDVLAVERWLWDAHARFNVEVQ